MGVPKFFRWLSERYPCMSVYVEDNQIPEFDCLYLDMNGIIHTCSHPNDNDVNLKLSESEMFKNIFAYIDHLLKIVKPKELFFLAVDGVAPRAKMNQQRCRRFKSALERKNRENNAIMKGEMKEGDKQFDSNAITPGTYFMERLHNALKSFVTEKMETDIQWQNIEVILSGHETPGEGEHKIQEFIRYRRTLPNYNPNTRHCLYGLDADLIILGLASHEPYFALLREEVIFFKKKDTRNSTANETKFHLLYISLLRDYIDCEFQILKTLLPDDYDLEQLIDDWIIMTFFVGNDFIPHIPNLHIHSAALPLLWNTYVSIRPKMAGYICDKGVINITNLLIFIKELSKFDFDNFQIQYEDMKWMMGKTGKKMNEALENLGITPNEGEHLEPENNLTEMFTTLDLNGLKQNDDIKELESFDFGDDKNNTSAELGGATDLDDEKEADDIFDLQYKLHKRDYYYSKMGLVMSDEILAQQAFEYIRAMQWISYYYFYGVPSWDWFYPQHYAPYVSDLTYIDSYYIQNGITFDLSKPFMPFEQLLAVLPPDSSELLPIPYQQLMMTSNSEIIDFYPKSFQTDINGKKAEWEALVLIPFIDEKRLLTAMEKKLALLTPEELKRNRHGPSNKFIYKSLTLSIQDIDPFFFRLTFDKVVHHLLDKVRLDLICRSFPSLYNGHKNNKLIIPFESNLEKMELKLFESNSRNLCMTLKIIDNPLFPNSTLNEENIELLCWKFINKIGFVNWPAIVEVKIVSLIFTDKKYTIKDNILNCQQLTNPQRDEINYIYETERRRLSYRKGVIINDENRIVVEGVFSEGKRYLVDSIHKTGVSLKTERIWSNDNSDSTKIHRFIQQLILLKDDIMPYNDCNKTNNITCSKLSQLIPTNSWVFGLEKNNYGVAGQVIGINNSNGYVKLKWQPLLEPNYSEIDFDKLDDDYMTCTTLSTYLNLSPLIISRMTGYLPIKLFNFEEKTLVNDRDCINKENNARSYIKYNKLNIGLSIRDNRGNSQIPEWVMSKEIMTEASKTTLTWRFSLAVVKQLDEYRDNFPEIFNFIQQDGFDKKSMDEVFNYDGDREIFLNKCDELLKYLKNLPFRNETRLSNDHKIIRQKIIKQLECIADDVDSYIPITTSSEECELPLSSLWTPHYSLLDTKPDLSVEYRLLDRVVCVTPDFTVPLGLRGVIIGVEPRSNGEIRLEVLFDKTFPGAIAIRNSQLRCFRMSSHMVINISHGVRKYQSNLVKPEILQSNLMKQAIIQSNPIKPHLVQSQPHLVQSQPKIEKDSIDNKSETVNFNVPPTPPIKFLEDPFSSERKNKPNNTDNVIKNKKEYANKSQINFISHCAQVYENSINVTYQNCPNEYVSFIGMCHEYGISDPNLSVTLNAKNSIQMSFTSSVVNIAEFEERNLKVALNKMTKLLQANLSPSINTGMGPLSYSQQSYPMYNNVNNMPTYYNNNNQHQHIFIPQQFNSNPFIQNCTDQIPLFPSQYGYVQHQQSQWSQYYHQQPQWPQYYQQQQHQNHQQQQQQQYRSKNVPFLYNPQPYDNNTGFDCDANSINQSQHRRKFIKKPTNKNRFNFNN